MAAEISIDLVAARLELGPYLLGPLAGGRHVDLVQRDQPRPSDEFGAGRVAVGGQLFFDRGQIGGGAAARFLGRAVDHVDQGGTALHVPEEVVAQALALAGARDQARHVGHHELDVAGLDHAEVRDQGGERVVGDLRAGRGHGRDQGGLAGVGEADQPDVGDRLQLEDEIALLTRLALEGEPGRLAARRGQRRVAEPAPAACGGDEPGAHANQVGEHLAVGRLDLGPVRHRDDQVRAVGAGAVGALALPAIAGPAHRPAVKVEQGGRARVHLEDHVTPAAPVTPVRAAERLELLPVNRGAAVPAVASLHLQRDPVGELRHDVSSP